ncbi:MAG: PKD domain-containing protein [Nitrospirae bacterium]|nr:PKD domain-containing protein [Nitrospirota bacterium]
MKRTGNTYRKIILFLLFVILLMPLNVFAENMTFNLLKGVNGISLPFANTGISDAEGLCRSIPYCESVAYWDVQGQAFVTHNINSAENNFSLTHGYPYFVTVSQDTVWTVSGDIPESITFYLFTTPSTDINTVTLPPYLSHITNAETLAGIIPNTDTVWFWDQYKQGFIGHPLGTEINNFSVAPYYPYFVNVTADTTWTVEALKALISAVPKEGGTPLTVQFSAIPTGGSPPYSYTWDIDSDGIDDYFVKDFTHTYNQAGTYTATLKVKDIAGNTALKTVTITVIQSNKNPIANPGGPYTGVVGEIVQFNGSGSSDPDGDPLTYIWDFGDEGTGVGVNPNHTYSNTGTYTVKLTVTDGRGGIAATQTTANIIELPTPKITSFSPTEGKSGTPVSIYGRYFDRGGLSVSFNGANAVIANFTGAAINTSVPLSAATGPITVTTVKGSAQSAEPFTVLQRQDFELNISPQSFSIPYNGKASAVISIQNTGTEQFTGAIKLSANTISGVTASFKPEYISYNQSSVLYITSSLSSSGVLTIVGTTNREGVDVTKTATVVINPIPPGITTLSSQALASRDAAPIQGVTLTIGDKTVVTDEAGNFIFIDPPVGEQILMVDGHTANHDGITYPSRIPVAVSINGGTDNTLPYPVYIHEAKTDYYTVINPSADTIVTDPEIPNYEMKIPAGVTITGWDGQPNTKVSVSPVSIDRLPIKPPPDGVYATEIYMYYFFKPGGGYPSQPIPVKMPNTFQAQPGERTELWYYDESSTPDPNSNQWKPFGMGTVSEDGRNIIPDAGVGIPKFCCGASFPRPAPATVNPQTGKQPSPSDSSICTKGQHGVADPVDPYNGTFLFIETDIGYPSPSLIDITRHYKSDNTAIGPFGRGTSINYNRYLQGSGNALTYITPEAGRYILSRNADGSYTNTQYPFLRNVKAYLNPDSTRTLKFKNGSAYTFNASGMLIKETDANGNWVSMTRNSLGYITGINDSFGRSLAITNTNITIGLTIYTVISSITDAFGRTVSYSYDSSARLTSVTDPEGKGKTYTYDTANRITSIKNKKGITEVTNTYDAEGRVIRQTHADGGVFDISYTMVGGTITETAVTEPNGKATTYRFNNTGYPVEITDTYGQKTIHERAFATNELKSVTDPLGRKTTYTHDANGNITTITDPVGNVTTYEYNLTFNKPAKIIDALGNTATLTYDSKGNLTEYRSPKTELTTIAYNTNGLPASITDALNNTTTFEYDSYGNLTKATDPLGNSAQMQYDLIGKLIAAIDPKGKSTSYVYDLMNRITEVVDALYGITRFTYDANGNLTFVIDAKNQVIRYEYDERDRVKKMIDQLGNIETYVYDKMDNLASAKDRKGQVTTYTYDLLNRITKATYADGNSTSYFYDAVGRLGSISDSVSGSIQYTYSGTGCTTGCSTVADKVINEITPLGSISYAYDAIGRRTSMTVAGQPAVNYSYDANSRLTGISNSGLGFDIAYDEIGRRTSMTLPNGVTTNYSYDNGSNLLEIKHLNPISQILEKINYVYAANGNRTSMDRLNVAPKLPNPVSNTSYNEANQMLTFNDKTMTYDANGNMETITNSCGTTTYTWDARNRLVDISGFDALCSPLSAAFKYDALGRRIEKTINGDTAQYLYDGLDIIQEIKDGVVYANYIRTLNIDEPLTLKNKDGVYYYIYDGLGSVIGLTDSFGQEVVQYNYDPFGNTSTNNPSFKNPFQYVGRENDETGLYAYRTRYYSPELHRFISPDPIGFAGGDTNFFSYTRNSPVNFVDPLGLWTFQIGFGGSAGAGGGGTAISGLVFGYSKECGFQFGTFETLGGGGYGGLSASLTLLELSFSKNKNISDLAGTTATLQQSFGYPAFPFSITTEENIPKDKKAEPSYSISLNFGKGPTFIEGHFFVMQTWVQKLVGKK